MCGENVRVGCAALRLRRDSGGADVLLREVLGRTRERDLEFALDLLLFRFAASRVFFNSYSAAISGSLVPM